MKHGQMTQKLLSVLLAVVMLWSVASQTFAYAYAADTDTPAQADATDTSELDSDEQKNAPDPAEAEEEEQEPEQEQATDANEEGTPDNADAAAPEDEADGTAQTSDETADAPDAVRETPDAPADEQAPLVITDWTWVTDEASISESDSVTLEGQSVTATVTAGGPRKVKPINNGVVCTWDDVYAALPEQIKAQDQDGNEVIIDLLKEDGKVVWTYSGGKLGEGNCPQSGTYVFEAQVDSATGTLADTAKRLRITVTFGLTPDDDVGNLDNGLNTENGLPNYGIRIIISANQNYEMDVDKQVRFLMEAYGSAAACLVVERYRWDDTRGKFRLYNNRDSYSSQADYGFEWTPAEEFDFTFGEKEDDDDGRFLASRPEATHLAWNLGYELITEDARRNSYMDGQEVIVIRAAERPNAPHDYGNRTNVNQGEWSISISGLLDRGRKLERIQTTQSTADKNPMYVAGYSSAVTSTFPNKTGLIPVPNVEDQITVIKLTYGDQVEPSNYVPDHDLTFDTDNGLPNYGVRVILDAPEYDFPNPGGTQYWGNVDVWEAAKMVRFRLTGSTDSDSNLVVERYRYDENLGKYRIFNNRASGSPEAYNAYRWGLNKAESYVFGDQDVNDARFVISHDGDQNIAWTLGFARYGSVAGDAIGAVDASQGSWNFLHNYATGKEVLVIRPATSEDWGEQAGLSDTDWNITLSGRLENGRKLENIQICDTDAGVDPFAVEDWQDGVSSTVPNKTAELSIPHSGSQVTVVKLTYGEDVETDPHAGEGDEQVLSGALGLPNYGMRIIIDAPESNGGYSYYNSSTDQMIHFILSGITEDDSHFVLERYWYDEDIGQYRLYNFRNPNTSQIEEAYSWYMGSSASWNFGGTSDDDDGRFLITSGGVQDFTWDLSYPNVCSPENAVTSAGKGRTYNGPQTAHFRTYVLGKQIIVLRPATAAEWREHAGVSEGDWSISISGKQGDGRMLENIQVSQTAAGLDPFEITQWTSAVDKQSPNETAQIAVPDDPNNITVIKLTYGEEVEPKPGTGEEEVDPTGLTLTDELGLPNYGLRLVIDNENADSTGSLYFTMQLEGMASRGDLVFERYRFDEDTQKYQFVGEAAKTYNRNYSNGLFGTFSTYSPYYQSHQIGWSCMSITNALNWKTIEKTINNYTDSQQGTVSANEIIVIRPGDGEGRINNNLNWGEDTGLTSAQEGVAAAQMSVSFIQSAYSSAVWNTSYPLMTSISMASDSGDPLKQTEWTVLADSGWLQSDPIEIPCVPGKPVTVKLTYGPHTGGDNELVDIDDTGTLTDDSEDVIIIRNDAAAQTGADYDLTVYSPNIPVNRYAYRYSTNWGYSTSSFDGLVIGVQIYDYDEASGVYTYSRTVERSSYSRQWNNWFWYNNRDYYTIYPGENAGYHISDLGDNQAIVIRSMNPYYTLTYDVKGADAKITGFDMVSGENGTMSGTTYTSGNVAGMDFGSLFPDPDDGQVVVLHTTMDMTADPFTRLANSSEITGSDTKEMRTLKVNLFDYELGFSQLQHLTDSGKNLGHNPKFGTATVPNHGAELRFVYDASNNKNDPTVSQKHAGPTTGIVADTLNSVLDDDGNVVAYLTPALNYSAQFAPFTLEEWTGSGYTWDDGGDGVTVESESKKVYANVDFEFVYNSKDGTYSYDSHQHHAQLTADGTRVNQYSETLGLGGSYKNPTYGIDGTASSSAAGFYPFDGPEATNFNGVAYTGLGYSKDGSTLLRRERDLDYHFGMSMQYPFTVPYGGVVKGRDMVFSISGDDDIWLFVDGKLVLDLGGIHNELSGEVNFTKGTYMVNGKTYELADLLDGFDTYPTAGDLSSGEGAWAAGTEHSFQLFYLERGGNQSNLSLSFNLPGTVVKATKVWQDYDNYDGSRQDAVFELQSSTDGESFQTVDTATISQVAVGNNLTHVWSSLPRYDSSNNKLTYRVVEQEAEGYTTTVEQPSESEYIFTNSHDPKADVQVTVKWADVSDYDGIRQDAVLVLERTVDGKTYEEVGAGTVSRSATGDDLIYLWADLPRFDENDNEMTYRVTPQKMKDYTFTTETTARDTYVVTYQHTPATDIKVSAQWNDENNKHGLRPDSIRFVLQRTTDGKNYENVANAAIRVKSGNGALIPVANQTYTWSNQPLFDANENRYTFRVQANDVRSYAVDVSNRSNEQDVYDILITHDYIQLLATPGLPDLTAAPNGIIVKWDAVEGAEKYRVFRKGESGTWEKLGDTASTNWVDRSAVKGKTYAYTICCVTMDSKTLASDYDPNGRSILYYLATPQITKLQGASNGIIINWNKISGAQKYRVWRKTNGGNWVRLGDASGTSWVDRTAQQGTKYTYTVRCVSADGTIYTSTFDSVGKTIHYYFATPKITSLQSGSSGIIIGWDTVSGAAKYRVMRRTGSGDWETLGDTSATNWVDRTAVKGKTYYYTVRCVTSDGKTYSSDYNTTGWKVTR